MKSHNLLRQGFTLIELLIVLSIISIIIPIVFSIIYILLNQQVQIYRIVETKRQGDRIMSFMKEKITREALSISDSSGTPRCATFSGNPENTTNGDEFLFLKNDTLPPETFNFVVTNNTLIAKDSVSMINTSLHDSKIRVSDFEIECFKRSNVADPMQLNRNVVLVGFSYTVTFVDSTPSDAEGDTTLQYHTKIRIR